MCKSKGRSRRYVSLLHVRLLISRNLHAPPLPSTQITEPLIGRTGHVIVIHDAQLRLKLLVIICMTAHLSLELCIWTHKLALIKLQPHAIKSFLHSLLMPLMTFPLSYLLGKGYPISAHPVAPRAL
jgi:hypothetical protein